MQTNEYPPSQVECGATKIEANIKSRAQATKDIVQNFLYAELDHVSQAVELKTEYKTCQGRQKCYKKNTKLCEGTSNTTRVSIDSQR